MARFTTHETLTRPNRTQQYYARIVLMKRDFPVSNSGKTVISTMLAKLLKRGTESTKMVNRLLKTPTDAGNWLAVKVSTSERSIIGPMP